MDVYILLMIWSIISASIYLIKINKYLINKLYIILVYIPLILIAGLRHWSVGTDTWMYLYWYTMSNNIDFNFNFFTILSDGANVEIGYAWLNYILNLLYFNDQSIIFLMSLLTILGFGIFFYRYSKSLWLSTFLFIGLISYQETFNMVRQAFAAMIMCNAYGFLIEDKKYKYLLTILPAMLFHFTAIIYFFIGLFMPIKIKKFLFIIIAGILVFLLGENIIIAQLIDWAPKYVAYFDSTLTRARGIGAGIIQPIFILTLMMASYYFVRLNKFNSEEKKQVEICNIFMIFTILETSLQYVLPILARFNPYCFTYILILVPLILDKIKFSLLKYIIYILIIIITFIYCIYSMSLGRHGVVPYKLFY